MKLLLFSDLHCDEFAARSLVQRASKADVLIGAGDFGQGRSGIDICINILQSVEKPTVLVPGNSESVGELTAACKDWPSAQVLHGSGTTIEGVEFFGIGGGIPVTPFGSWSYDFTEEQATELLKDCPTGGVLVSHSPPKGVVDVSSSGRSLGSTAIRAAIERCQPQLVVCGHIHESGGRHGLLGDVPIVNAGVFGILWDLETKQKLA
jgi:Icc-related predicted phosphoesterase